MTSTLEVVVDLKSGPEKVWLALKDSTKVFPEALPHHYSGIDIIKGDGYSVGTIRLVKFAPGKSEIASTKEKIESLDLEKKTVSYSVVDGDMLKYYKYFQGKTEVSPKGGDEGSLVKWSCAYEKASDDVPNPDMIRDFAITTFKDLDVFLQKAN